MIPFRNTVIAVLAISLITFIALFGRLPALRKTPIGFTHRLLCLHIPRGFRIVDSRFTNGRLTRSISSLTTYLLYKKNPVVLLLFLSLLSGSSTIFLRAALPLLSTRQILPIPFILGSPFFFTYLCVTSKADYITPQSHSKHLYRYPYDHILYRPDHICRTCNFQKPARSKHCSLCGVCVAKCDHHCPWINNCLGQHNYRYFLLLLLSLGVLELYGAFLSWRIISPNLAASPNLPIFSTAYCLHIAHSFVYAMNIGGLGIAGVGLLALTTIPLPFALLIYHVYLIWAGMTTNETAKWADWRDDMTDGHVWKSKRTLIQTQQENDTEEERKLTSTWGVQCDQVIVRTTDGRPPRGQEQLWQWCTGLDMVVNIYDLGFRRNLIAVVKGE